MLRKLLIRLSEEQKQKVDKVALFTNLPYARIFKQALDLYYETKPFEIKNPTHKEGNLIKNLTLFLDEYHYSELKDMSQETQVPMTTAVRQILLWYLETAKLVVLDTTGIINATHSKVG